MKASPSPLLSFLLWSGVFATPASALTIDDCSAPPVRAVNHLTRIDAPAEPVVIRCALTDLRGDGAASNAARLREALQGRDTPAHRDALVLGAALALEVTGAEPDARSAVARARGALASGAGAKLLDAIAAFAKELAP